MGHAQKKKMSPKPLGHFAGGNPFGTEGAERPFNQHPNKNWKERGEGVCHSSGWARGDGWGGSTAPPPTNQRVAKASFSPGRHSRLRGRGLITVRAPASPNRLPAGEGCVPLEAVQDMMGCMELSQPMRSPTREKGSGSDPPPLGVQ